jgi:hypothetical protein
MNEVFTSWEEMTELEQMQCQYWDMYKDAYGVRPRGIDTSSWTAYAFQVEFEHLALTIQANEIQRQEAEATAVKNFEQHVINTMCMGARDRETALRWIMEASTANGDWEYFCFLNGLPYRYFERK